MTQSEGRARRPSVSVIKTEAVTISLLCSRHSARGRLIVRGKSGHRRMPVVDD